ncbi:unnamed protein product [Blepharisma stoltei]|uniref:Uncharacterized protein n=1 Tax=Blepharisma stoltei TaxID=1481888 RepID=A0AAU9JJ42_9CILI|nr:unnamed protein product [Blepharisma stoltei]
MISVLVIACAIFALTASESPDSQSSIQSIHTLLQDLKSEFLLEQNEDDSKQFSHNRNCIEILSSFSKIGASTQSLLEHRQNAQKLLSDEIEAVKGEIDYLNENLSYSQKRLQELSGLRCDQSTIFLHNLKDIKEAESSIADLRKNTNIFFNTENTELVQIAAKISSLVPQSGNIFTELTENAALDVPNLLNNLKSLIKENVKKLEDEELQNARNFADWHINIKKEIQRISEELQQKGDYAEKLLADLSQAEAAKEEAVRANEDFKMVMEAQQAECETQKKIIEKDTQRRKENIEILDESIQILEN